MLLKLHRILFRGFSLAPKLPVLMLFNDTGTVGRSADAVKGEH